MAADTNDFQVTCDELSVQLRRDLHEILDTRRQQARNKPHLSAKAMEGIKVAFVEWRRAILVSFESQDWDHMSRLAQKAADHWRISTYEVAGEQSAEADVLIHYAAAISNMAGLLARRSNPGVSLRWSAS